MSKLTREDFRELAQIIGAFRKELEEDVWEALFFHICNFCEKRNERFDRSRFRKACLEHSGTPHRAETDYSLWKKEQVEKLLEEVREMGRRAGREDWWMFPSEEWVRDTLEENKERAREEFGELTPGTLVETMWSGWEETDHFKIVYYRKITAKIEELGLPREGWFCEYWENVRNAFWNGVEEGLMEEGIDVYKLAEEVIKREEEER